jgi:hypothetical protein
MYLDLTAPVYKKFMSKTFPIKIDKNFDVSFSSAFFGGVLSHFRVLLSSQRWEFKIQKNDKARFTKNRVEKKNRQKYPRPFFLDFLTTY